MSILFLDDWINKYPGAIVHDDTSNKSFVHIAKVIDSMGVQNSAFPLALHNPDLRDINPHDPDISMTEIAMVTQECIENVWYFLREILIVPPNTGIEGIPFRANRGTIAVFWLFFTHINTIVVQPRQTGKTISMSSLFRYLLNIGSINTQFNFLTLDDVLREETVGTVRALEEELPPYLNLTRADDSKKNSSYVTVNALKNILRGFLPQRSPKAARNVMRGQTTPAFWIDEASSLYNIDISLPVLLMAGNSARHEAEEIGAPYGTILTTNAGDKADKSAKYIYKLLQDSTVWSEKFFDCKNNDDLEKTIAMGNSAGEVRINATFSHRQLGYTDEWLSKNLHASMASGRDAEKDLLNRWKDGSAESPLSKDDLSTIVESLVNDVRTEITPISNYVVRFYESEEIIDEIGRTSGIIIAIDTSDAVGRDDISFVARELKHGAVIAAATINDVNLMGFAEWVASWLIKHDRIVLIPERRSSGATIVDIIIELLLAKGIDPFTKIFNWVVQDIDKHPDIEDELSKPSNMRSSSMYIKYRKEFGYGTSAMGRSSRNNLYGISLTQSVSYTAHLVRDSVIINQLTSLITKNGRIDHSDGEHDDMVIGWLLSYWLLSFGKNLNIYNLVTTDILSHNSKIHNTENKNNRNEQEYILEVKNKINELSRELVSERDIVLSSIKEARLKGLIDEFGTLTGSSISFSELKNNIELARKRNR